MPKFRKSERLSGINEIDHLFKEGYSLFRYPLKIKWLPVQVSNNVPIKVVISVSKRRFRHAIDRNRLKRVIRECYRLNKSILENGIGSGKCHLALIYAGKEMYSKNEIEPIIIELFSRLIKEYESLTN